MKANELMAGNLVMVNKDGLCIKKGTIVRVVEVDSENKLPEKGLVGSARCVDVNDRSVSGGIWCEYLSPIPTTSEVLEKNGFKKGDFCWSWRKGNDEVCIIFARCRVVEISYTKLVFNPEDPEEIDYGSKMEFGYGCGCAVHQLQQFLKLNRIEKDIVL